MSFGIYFRDLRVKKGFTQAQIAHVIGKTRMLVSGVETEKNGASSESDLEKIAVALRLDDEEKKELLYQAAFSRNRIPADYMTYLTNHKNAFLLLGVMERNQMDNELVQKLLEYAEELNNAENG